MFPDDVIFNPMFASDDVAKVCDDPVWKEEYSAPRPVRPPDEPASNPQPNCPVAEFQISLSAEPEHDVKPAPKTYPELRFNPRVILKPPAIVDVDVLVIARLATVVVPNDADVEAIIVFAEMFPANKLVLVALSATSRVIYALVVVAFVVVLLVTVSPVIVATVDENVSMTPVVAFNNVEKKFPLTTASPSTENLR